MPPSPLSPTRAAIEKLEQELRAQGGALVTEEQLQRILSIHSLQDLNERVSRLNEIHDDLQRQASEAEANWRLLEARIHRLPKLSADDQKLLDELHTEMIANIRAEAIALLNRDVVVAGAGIPRRARMTI